MWPGVKSPFKPQYTVSVSLVSTYAQGLTLTHCSCKFERTVLSCKRSCLLFTKQGQRGETGGDWVRLNHVSKNNQMTFENTLKTNPFILLAKDKHFKHFYVSSARQGRQPQFIQTAEYSGPFHFSKQFLHVEKSSVLGWGGEGEGRKCCCFFPYRTFCYVQRNSVFLLEGATFPQDSWQLYRCHRLLCSLQRQAYKSTECRWTQPARTVWRRPSEGQGHRIAMEVWDWQESWEDPPPSSTWKRFPLEHFASDQGCEVNVLP